MKIGILGGSFDPIHYGHIYMAKQALDEYQLDEIWFIPAGHSPNKEESKMTSALHRKAMCELALSDEHQFKVCSLEIDSKERSYTYRTMQKLTAQYPMHQFYFIMGADSLDYFDKWKNPQIISSLAVILVVNRNSFTEEDLHTKIASIQKLFSADIHIVHCQKYPISSSEIREMIGKNIDISSFLNKQVISYIQENHLYQGVINGA